MIKKYQSLTFAIVLLAGGVTGCVSSSPLTSPNGQPGFAIDCSGGGGRWQACYEEAASLCPDGYEVFDRVGDSDTLISDVDGDFSMSTMVSRELMIECH